jgi:hypothetical protein
MDMTSMISLASGFYQYHRTVKCCTALAHFTLPLGEMAVDLSGLRAEWEGTYV